MTLGTVAMETEARLATSTIVDMYLRLHVVKIEAFLRQPVLRRPEIEDFQAARSLSF
jgi:hypothetical protein